MIRISRLEAGDQEHRGHALLHQLVVVAACKQTLLGHRVRRQLNARLSRGFPDKSLQCAVLRTEGHHVREGVGEQGHVQVDVGDDILHGHRRVFRKIARSQQSLFLSGDDQEQHRAVQLLCRQHPGRLQQSGDTGRIVHGAVVDIVLALLTGNHTEVIQVGAVHEILTLEPGMAAFYRGNNVG